MPIKGTRPSANTLELIAEAAEVRLGTQIAGLILPDAEQPLAALSASELRQVRGGLVELSHDAPGDEVAKSIDSACEIVDAELDREDR